MIGRMWRGWTKPENGTAYEEVFKTKVLSELNRLEGCDAAYLLRRDRDNEVEFVSFTVFKSIEAVQEFTGENYELAVISPEARQVLERFEESAIHYEIVVARHQ